MPREAGVSVGADDVAEGDEMVVTSATGGRPSLTDAEAERGRYGVGRLLTLVDGVFAISMTLLALDVRFPDSVEDTPAAFAGYYGTFLRLFLVFVAAFVISSRFWLVSHRQLAALRAVDRGVLQRVILFLAGITALPVATNVLFRYGDIPGAITFAALVLAVTSALSGRLWWYLSSPGRGLADVDPDERGRVMLRSVIVVVIYLLAVPVAYALGPGHADVAPLVWFLLAVVNPVTNALHGRFRRRGRVRG